MEFRFDHKTNYDGLQSRQKVLAGCRPGQTAAEPLHQVFLRHFTQPPNETTFWTFA